MDRILCLVAGSVAVVAALAAACGGSSKPPMTPDIEMTVDLDGGAPSDQPVPAPATK